MSYYYPPYFNRIVSKGGLILVKKFKLLSFFVLLLFIAFSFTLTNVSADIGEVDDLPPSEPHTP